MLRIFHNTPFDFIRWWRVAAALTVGRSEDLDVARRLIAARTEVMERRAELADADSDLSALAAA